jgi:hypothetical protein
LIGQSLALQPDAHRIGKAKEHASPRGIERIGAPQHHRDDRDPSAPRAHVLGKDADRAERELRAGKAAERAGGKHRRDAIGRDIYPQGFRRVRLLADASQAQSNGRAKEYEADRRDKSPSGPGQDGLAREAPADDRNVSDRGKANLAEADDSGIAEDAADAEDYAQEIGGKAGSQKIHSDADHHLVAAKDRRAKGEDQREGHRGDHRRRDAARRALAEVAADDRREGADEHMSFQRHVEHADPLA